MAATTGANLGLHHSWALGEDGWNAGMDGNLKTLDAVVHLSVKALDLAAPPASPATGDRYIVGASPTGAWVGKAGQIAVWSGSAWAFYPPKKGWRAFVEDEPLLLAWTGSAWVVPVSPAAIGAVDAAASTSRLVLFVRDMATPPGNQYISGVGFQPRSIVFMSATQYPLQGAGISFGMAEGLVAGSVQQVGSVGNFTSLGYVVAIRNETGFALGSIVNMHADGFTLGWSNSSPAGSGIFDIYAMCIR